MKKILLTLLIASFFASNIATAQTNASSYYRKIASEQRKIRTKQVIFYKTSMQFTDDVRLQKSREMVMTQVEATKKIMTKIPAYQGDSALKKDYMRILDVYTEAYTTAFDSVQKLQKTMSKSEEAQKKYQDAFYYSEDLIDEAEDMWEMNENYFTGSYNVNAMEDPTAAQLFTLRSLAIYVQDMRACYASVSFKIISMQEFAAKKKFENFEDLREELAMKSEQAMVAVSHVGEYIDEKEKEDDILQMATLYYLEHIKEGANDDLAKALMAYEEARYEDDEKGISKAEYKIGKVLEEFTALGNDLNERTTKFVNHYAEK